MLTEGLKKRLDIWSPMREYPREMLTATFLYFFYLFTWIDILCANTPQAKGRVERANKTLQDRLVKELRLQGISTIGAELLFRRALIRF
jgi:hypothetical protein